MRGSIVVASIAALVTIAPSAFPCSIVSPSEHPIDTTSPDRIAPTLSRAELVAVARGQGPRDQGCGSSTDSCDDLGWVRVRLEGADETTLASELGFFIELESGALPSGMALPTTPVRAAGNEVQLTFVDGAIDEQESIDFVLRVSAVDRAGNKSAPRSVGVSHDGREATCTYGGGRGRWGLAMLGAAIALGWRRRCADRSRAAR